MVVELLLPDRCASCGEDGPALCERCRGRLHRLTPPLCGRCGAPVAYPVDRCVECARRRLGFAQARAAVAYEGPAVAILGAWKERGRRTLAAAAATLVAGTIERPSADVVTYVPAVPDRRRWRGHNPAEELAALLGSAWKMPVAALLERHGAPPRQRGLGLRERRQNVAGAFAPLAAVSGRICVVDDVYTTGATLHEAAVALRRAGGETVVAVTFARTLRVRGPPQGSIRTMNRGAPGQQRGPWCPWRVSRAASRRTARGRANRSRQPVASTTPRIEVPASSRRTTCQAGPTVATFGAGR